MSQLKKRSGGKESVKNTVFDTKHHIAQLPNDGSVTFTFPSRFFSAAGIVTFFVSLALTMYLNRLYDHDIGGLYWPYLSDVAKQSPESAIWSLGMTLTSVWLIAAITLNYGKVKRDIEASGRRANQSEADWSGYKRNKTGLVLGCVASPFLGLLACFDTARSPGLHMLFVLGFFPLMLGYVFVNTSVYKILAKRNPQNQELQVSYRVKLIICVLLLIFVVLYLPVGMAMVSNW
eukprot:TRINITY_DN10632_c0_g1_i3.p1 TRINITY_DN10632_c0_g1~~TRINITY_DN10632_c0_g1_i3.p1  ORF type:complete len:233 (-),score=41.96 TRINITY_DN10632_c0_g1_i3:244-942(-)